jgi:hypothetical protein
VDDIGNESEEEWSKEMNEDVENGVKTLRDKTVETEFGKLVRTTGVTNESSSTKTETTYAGLSSPGEEAVILMDKVKTYLFSGDLSEASWLPWEKHKSTDYKTLERKAKIKAIQAELGIQSDGNDVPMTLRQKVMYSSSDQLNLIHYMHHPNSNPNADPNYSPNSNSNLQIVLTTHFLTLLIKLYFGTVEAKLEYKLSKVRRETASIIEKMEGLKDSESAYKDMHLIRSFVYECLSPFKRFILVMNIETFCGDLRQKPSWVMYIITWIFTTGKR